MIKNQQFHLSSEARDEPRGRVTLTDLWDQTGDLQEAPPSKQLRWDERLLDAVQLRSGCGAVEVGRQLHRIEEALHSSLIRYASFPHVLALRPLDDHRSVQCRADSAVPQQSCEAIAKAGGGAWRDAEDRVERGAATAVVLGPKMAAVLCASGMLRSSSKPPPAALGLRVTPSWSLRATPTRSGARP